MSTFDYLDELAIRAKYPNLADEVGTYIQILCSYALVKYKENALFYPTQEMIDKILLDLSDRLYGEVVSALSCYVEPPCLWKLICENVDAIQNRYIDLFISLLS
jgi:hypothetical protein